MKSLKYILSIGVLASILLGVNTSCTIEADSSKKLGGFWHLESIDTLATGGHTDLSDKRLFWSAASRLLEVADKDKSGSVFFTYEHTGDSLKLGDAYVNDRNKGDWPLDDVTRLRKFGINQLHEGFAVLALDGNKLILQSSLLQLHLKRF